MEICNLTVCVSEGEPACRILLSFVKIVLRIMPSLELKFSSLDLFKFSGFRVGFLLFHNGVFGLVMPCVDPPRSNGLPWGRESSLACLEVLTFFFFW